MSQEASYQCRWALCADLLTSLESLEEHVSRHVDDAPKIEMGGVKRRKIGMGMWVRVEHVEHVGLGEAGGEGDLSVLIFQGISDHLPPHASQAGDTTMTTDTTYPIPSFPSLPIPPSLTSLPTFSPPEQNFTSPYDDTQDYIGPSQAYANVDGPNGNDGIVGVVGGAEMQTLEAVMGLEPGDDLLREMFGSPSPEPEPESESSQPQNFKLAQARASGLSPSQSFRKRGRSRSPSRTRSASPFVPPTQAIYPTQVESRIRPIEIETAATTSLEPFSAASTTARSDLVAQAISPSPVDLRAPMQEHQYPSKFSSSPVEVGRSHSPIEPEAESESRRSSIFPPASSALVVEDIIGCLEARNVDTERLVRESVGLDHLSIPSPISSPAPSAAVTVPFDGDFAGGQTQNDMMPDLLGSSPLEAGSEGINLLVSDMAAPQVKESSVINTSVLGEEDSSETPFVPPPTLFRRDSVDHPIQFGSAILPSDSIIASTQSVNQGRTSFGAVMPSRITPKTRVSGFSFGAAFAPASVPAPVEAKL